MCWDGQKKNYAWANKRKPKYHQQSFIRWPWKIISSVRCLVCGRAEHAAFSRCSRFMPNTCAQTYIHANTHTHIYTHTLCLEPLGTLLSLARLCGAVSIRECGHMGSALHPNPTITIIYSLSSTLSVTHILHKAKDTHLLVEPRSRVVKAK